MSDYSKALDNIGWAEHYNINSLNSVVDSIMSGNVSIWSEELIKISSENEKILEIGCGSGTSSLWLAKHKRIVTALDYTESSISLMQAAGKKLNLEKNCNVVLADATKELPFEEKEFDMAFQSGLLEHFSTDMQIELLRNWKRNCKKMVSMIPNAASIPYRVGKQISENNNTWTYGLEIPKHSLIKEFMSAGIKVEKEYTIGTEWALKFLPSNHYIRKIFIKLKKQGFDLDDMMQGYLLVTIGDCED